MIVVYDGVVRYTDPNGKVLLVAKQNRRALTVNSGDVVLDNVEGFGVCWNDISVVNAMGERIFREEKDDTDHRIHRFVQGSGAEIGRLRDWRMGTFQSISTQDWT